MVSSMALCVLIQVEFKSKVSRWGFRSFCKTVSLFLVSLPAHARYRDATTHSPCWAPHFMTQERIMFSNPTTSKPRLSPAATVSDNKLSALTPPLHCASISQPAIPPQVVAFES